MKKIMWGISFLALIGTAALLQFFPDSVPMHYDFAGNIDRWGSKYEKLIFPAIILLGSLFWTLLMGHYEKKARTVKDEKESEGAKGNAKVLGLVGVTQALMFTVLHGFLLYGAYTITETGAQNMTIDVGKVSCILMGVTFIVLGNFMTKTRVNGSVGLRISWSMYNDNTWRRSNRFAAIGLMAEGLVAILAALLMKNSMGALFLTMGVGAVVVTASVIFAHKVYLEEKEAEKKATSG